MQYVTAEQYTLLQRIERGDRVPLWQDNEKDLYQLEGLGLVILGGASRCARMSDTGRRLWAAQRIAIG